MNLTLFKTKVYIKPIVIINLLGLWGMTTGVGIFHHPGRGLGAGILIGFLAMILLLVADFGHALAHIFSARAAKAPLDEINISAGMPRTIYLDNEISPVAHRTRALGGPIFSFIGLCLSAVLYWTADPFSLQHDLAGWSALGHGLIFLGSLLPLPVVDGGSILKWTLVKKGQKEKEADQILITVDWIIGAVCMIAGIGFLLTFSWIVGLVLFIIGGIFIAAALGMLK